MVELGALLTSGLRRRRYGRLALFCALALALAACGSSASKGVYKLGKPYKIAGRWYQPVFDPEYDEVGVASWYGRQFHGRRTANGETFDLDELTAAHPTLPLPSIVRVTNLANNRQIEVRVNDRGPFAKGRIIDLSQEAARRLGFERQGTARVRVQFLRLADAEGKPPKPTFRRAQKPSGSFGLQLAAAPSARCVGQYIQVGAFSDHRRAQRLARQLNALLEPPVQAVAPGRNGFFRVVLGPVADPGETNATLRRLRQAGYEGAFIVGAGGSSPVRC